MRKLQNQKGFAVLEVVLAVLLLGAIAAAGYFAYQDHKKPSTASTTAAKSTASTPKTTAGTSATSADNSTTVDAASASSFLNGFYTSFLGQESTFNNSSASVAATFIEGYATPSFSQQLQTGAGAMWRPYCGEQSVSAFSLGAVSVANNVATIPVSLTPASSSSISVNVVKLGGAYKIDDISCN